MKVLGKDYRYECLVVKRDGVHSATTNEKAEAAKWMTIAAKQQMPVLLIGIGKDGERAGIKAGPDEDWCKYTRLIRVTFDGVYHYTYIARNIWEVGDSREVLTPYGVRTATVSLGPKWFHIAKIADMEDRIHKEFKIFEEVIVDDNSI